MKCQVTSNITHGILISKEMSYKSYKQICRGDSKKVNLGYNSESDFKIENNSLVHIPKKLEDYSYGKYTSMLSDWEILSPFFSTHNIEPNWLDCNYTYGWYDEDLGGWTGCMGKV